jgi:23S rRNA (adenine2503-C2)-methyltransferase
MKNNTQQPIVLRSAQDLSANFVSASGQESRFVRRTDDFFIAYLSSHNGCNLSCRFCHLTQTGQTSFVESSLSEMWDQARLVLEHYRQQVASGAQPPASKVHFNWMARGEPLASSVVTGQWEALTQGLVDLAASHGLHDVRFNVSSIFPKEAQAHKKLALMRGAHRPIVFYSLYSVDPAFRKRWLPKAADPSEVLDALSQWQASTDGEIVFHWALIHNENDSVEAVEAVKAAISSRGIRARFNLVRYNPFSEGQGVESHEDVLDDRFNRLRAAMTVPGSRIVPRVGFDVKASCGMFVADPSSMPS